MYVLITFCVQFTRYTNLLNKNYQIALGFAFHYKPKGILSPAMRATLLLSRFIALLTILVMHYSLQDIHIFELMMQKLSLLTMSKFL